MKILLTSFLLIFAFQFSFGQEKPKAEKLEDFGATTCGDIRNKLDNFLNEILLGNANAKGYVVIYSNNQEVLQGLSFENIVLGHLKLRLPEMNLNIDFADRNSEPKFIFVRKQTVSDLKIELWKVQKDELPSFAISDKWDLSNINYRKPTLFFTDLNESECNYASGIKQFSEILSANPNLRGHIVIFDKTQKDFLKTKNELLGEIPNKFNILKNQVRTFFIKTKGNSYPNYELWLVPKEKRN